MDLSAFSGPKFQILLILLLKGSFLLHEFSWLISPREIQYQFFIGFTRVELSFVSGACGEIYRNLSPHEVLFNPHVKKRLLFQN